MKKILLLLCLFLGMQTYAQDEVRELTTVIKVTPSSSERFDVAQLQLELNGDCPLCISPAVNTFLTFVAWEPSAVATFVLAFTSTPNAFVT